MMQRQPIKTVEERANLWFRVADLMARQMKYFVEDIIELHNEEFHDEIDDVISDHFYKKVVISFPRDHGKSTHLSVAYPLWEIARNHNVRILLISATAAISEGFMGEVLGHIQRNEKYQLFAETIDPTHVGVVPRLKPGRKAMEKWSGNKFIVDRSDLRMKDPTMNAVGIFGGIVSKRADIIICDDIVNQENAMTDGQRKKVIDWIYTTVMPVLVPGGRFIYLGNTWHVEDLVAHLMKDPQFDYQNTMGAIIKEADRQDLWTSYANILLRSDIPARQKKGMAEEFYVAHKADMDAGSQVLWPARYPYKDLYMLRLSNSYAFARMYQCNPSDRPDQKFIESWIDTSLRKGAKLKLSDDLYEGIEFDVVVEGLDLAIKEDETADDTAKVTLARVKYGRDDIKAGDIVVKQIKSGHFSPAFTRDMVRTDFYAQKPQPIQIRVETNGYQDAMRKDLEGFNLPVVGHHTGREKNDSDIGVNALAIIMEQGKLVLPSDPTDAHTTQQIAKLVSGMRAYPSDHTADTLMAAWLANMAMRDATSDRYLVPQTTMSRINKDPPDILRNKEIRQVEEKKADRVLELYQHDMRAAHNSAMRKFFIQGHR